MFKWIRYAYIIYINNIFRLHQNRDVAVLFSSCCWFLVIFCWATLFSSGLLFIVSVSFIKILLIFTAIPYRTNTRHSVFTLIKFRTLLKRMCNVHCTSNEKCLNTERLMLSFIYSFNTIYLCSFINLSKYLFVSNNIHKSF